MKIAILGDTHIDCRNSSLLFSNYQQKFFDNIFFPELERRNIKNIIQLGDVFDRRKFINFISLGLSKDFLFEKLNTYNTHIIVGNHDIPYRQSLKYNSPSLLLDQFSNIKIHTEPTETEFGLLLPWICNENYKECLKAIKTSSASYCFGHLEITGFEMYKGSVCLDGLNAHLFEKFHTVFSGHFHHKSDNGTIFYVGNPYQLTWSDYGDIRGFHIFDYDDNSLEFIPNPYEMFHKIYYNDEDKNDLIALQEKFNMYKDTYVKLIVNNKHDPYYFDTFLDNLYKAGVYDVTIIETMEETVLEDDVDETEDTITILSKYIDQMQVDVDKKKLNTFMKTLYKEAMEIE